MAPWTDRVEALRNNPTNVRFFELEAIVQRAGYALRRQTGSHRIYGRAGLPPLNLQMGKGGKAKAYQVRQFLAILQQHDIELK